MWYRWPLTSTHTLLTNISCIVWVGFFGNINTVYANWHPQTNLPLLCEDSGCHNTFSSSFISLQFFFLIFLHLTRYCFKVSQAATFQVNHAGNSTNRWCGCYFIIQHQQLFKVHIIKTYVSVIVTTTKNNICYMFFIFLCFPEKRPTSAHIPNFMKQRIIHLNF